MSESSLAKDRKNLWPITAKLDYPQLFKKMQL